MSEKRLPAREKMDQEYCWKLEDIFETDAAWEKALRGLEKETENIRELRGSLSGSAEQLVRGLEAVTGLEEKFESVYVYASQKCHQDMGNPKYQELCFCRWWDV